MYVFEADPTPTSGYWGDTTLDIMPSMLSQVWVKATTASTVFDVIVKDADSREIYKVENVVGILNDVTPYPTMGVYTVEIDNSTADEAFEVKLSFKED